jgi:predicted RNA-binding protein YlxR (DUF448 family)
MTKKLKILIAINVLLLTAVLLSLYTPENQTQTNSQAIFSLADTAGVNQFVIGENKLAKTARSGWLLDDKTLVQKAIIKGIFTILQKIEVKNELNGEANRRALENIKANGIKLKVLSSGQSKLEFSFTTQEGENLATLDGERAFSVFVPGLMVDLKRFFAVSPATWRENTLFETSPQTLKSFSVRYPKSAENSFSLIWDSTFFKVEGLNNLDSLALWNYIQFIGKVKAVQYIESQTLFDSIRNSQPFAEIEMQDIRLAKPKRLTVFALPSRLVARNQDNEVVELDFRNFNPRAKNTILVNKKFFEVK